MNPSKQHKKLMNLAMLADVCESREEAQKLIKKADKAHKKLQQ